MPEWLIGGLLFLALVYVAALLLTARDRYVPTKESAVRPRQPCPHPRYLRNKWIFCLVFPVWLAFAVFGLVMWAIVMGPVLVANRLHAAVVQRTNDDRWEPPDNSKPL